MKTKVAFVFEIWIIIQLFYTQKKNENRCEKLRGNSLNFKIQVVGFYMYFRISLLRNLQFVSIKKKSNFEN